ncbi:MAG: hypothetical protein AAEA78_01455 [Methylophilaceae bacterium]
MIAAVQLCSCSFVEDDRTNNRDTPRTSKIINNNDAPVSKTFPLVIIRVQKKEVGYEKP